MAALDVVTLDLLAYVLAAATIVACLTALVAIAVVRRQQLNRSAREYRWPRHSRPSLWRRFWRWLKG